MSKMISLFEKRCLSLLIVFLLAGTASLRANTHFMKDGMNWISHHPTYSEPWIVVNLLLYDNDGKDSFFNHAQGEDGHDGPAVYVNDEYICSPDWEMAWPGKRGTGNFSDLEKERQKEKWWGTTYESDKCVVRFWNPYMTKGGEVRNGYYIRVSMYVFLKEWKVDEKYRVKVYGKWIINDTSKDFESVELETKPFANPWQAPTATMKDFETVNLSGSLCSSCGPTTIGIFKKAEKVPSAWVSDLELFSGHPKYAKNSTSFDDATGELIRKEYDNTLSIPVQYSATFKPEGQGTGFVNKNGQRLETTVYTWFTVPVPGFVRPKNVTFSTENQWKKQVKVSWESVEEDADGNPLSTAGSWTVRNVTRNTDLCTGIKYNTKQAIISLEEYRKQDQIQVFFIPDKLGAQPSELSASTDVTLVPIWSFGDVTATDDSEGINLTWSHNAVGDASGDHQYTLYIQRSTDYDVEKKKGTWTDISTATIASDSIVSGHFTDNGANLEANKTYYYRLRINICKEDKYSDVVCAKLGGSKILQFTASRGNYSNMVKLQWSVQQIGATVSNFIIYRRPLGSEEDEAWRNIYTTSGILTNYSYDDVTALPGSFNDYKVVLYTQDGETRSLSDTQTTDGFSVSTGIISGNIAYGTGTAVDGAKVVLKQQDSDGEIATGLRSVRMSGFGAGFKYDCDTKTLNDLFGGDFSIQMYINPDSTIMADHDGRYLLMDVYKAFTLYLRYDVRNNIYYPGVYISGKYLETYTPIKGNAWTHLCCVHEGASGHTTLYVIDDSGTRSHVLQLNEDNLWLPATISPVIRDDDNCISIGNEASFKGEMYFNGYMDEFRFWKKALTEKDIQRNYNHPLAGSESGLAIYYPFDEGLTKQSVAYDFSKKDGISNGRHASTLTPASSSTQLPDEDMMSLMSYTDVNGYYEIRGIPFSGEGTSYSIIPTLGIHEFSPSQRSRFVSMSSINHSGVDFEDVSSFPVSGKVFYAGTDYPLEGANFYVDGTICSKDGEIIATNEQGEFTISVPIGDHFITVEKSGHVFANAGRYPADPNGVGTKITFDHEIKNLEFLDSTLVNFTGRVVGGSIEGDKAVGFGLSTNNIGITEFVLTPLNEIPRMNVVKQVSETTYSYETNTETVPVSSATEKIASTSWRGAGADDCRKIFVRTDSLTGEFSAMVPPLEYKVSAMKVVKTGLEVGESQTVDLSNPLQEYSDTLYNDDDTYELYTYNTILKQAYHSTPTFNVVQEDHKDGAFGISSYMLKDEQGELTIDDIYTLDNAGKPVYKYGGAVFEMYKSYVFNIEAYEEYVNSDDKTPIVFHVPLSDVVVTIDNALSDQQPVYNQDMSVGGENVTAGQVAELESNQLQLDSLGCATYEWKAGLPNITAPYTRTITISYDIDDRTYLWSGSGMEGIVLGNMPTGNNFITAGPDMVNMILRDPPGSKSSAEWTSGTIVSSSHADLGVWDSDSYDYYTVNFGPDITAATGAPGAYTVTNTHFVVDESIGVSVRVEGYNGDTYSTIVETTKSISTSDDPAFVGPQGDVFIGTSTNIIFGNARNLGFRRVAGGNTAQLNVADVISTGMQFSTMFNYTQSYIENTLIPNLRLVRNSMLKTVSQQTIDTYLNTGKKPVYLTVLSPDDPHFGEDNTDKRDEKGNVIPSSQGSSYSMFVPDGSTESYQDSVMWCNSQIALWESYLKQNEREKVAAYENRDDADSVVCENYSFDSGTRVTQSKEIKDSEGTKMYVKATVGVIFNSSVGGTTNGLGATVNIGTDTAAGYQREEEESTTDVTAFKYTLAEDGDDNALTVDVYEYGAFGPIFRTRGGQTSAPYEGKVVTKYYKPGTTIMDATMQIEVPQIAVDVPIVSDIPSGSAATYTLRLSNASETDATVSYRLMQVEESNPNGAQLLIDGAVLTNNRLIKIPAGETITKTLQLKQSDLSILDYDRIGIVLASPSQYYPSPSWDIIADTVFISAHYVPSSSPVTLALSNSIMNTQTGTDLVLTMKDFDRTYRGLKAFRLEYKKQGTTDWSKLHEYVLNEEDRTSNNELLPSTGSSVSYTLPMNSFSDGDYLFRVVSVSKYGTEDVCRYSDEMALVKDLQRPTPMGQPEPADGILDIGDELSVTFNEAILKGELTKEANFKVTGVLNGAEIAHETALSMTNTATAAASTEAAINLYKKDFAFDMWVKLTGGTGTLLSHGKGADKMSIDTDADGKLAVTIAGNTYTSDNTVTTDKWVFLSLSLTADGTLNATMADDANTTVLFKNLPVVPYKGNGPLCVGKDIAASIHELLLWDEAHDMETALLNRSKTKNPATRHLIGYWKMDEGEGKTIRDYARNRHMSMPEESWYLNNENKAVILDGESFLSINASELPTCMDDDYALEFWVRGGEQTGQAQLLQMGDVAFSVTAEGMLQLESNNSQFSILNSQLTDNAWHHVSLNVLRQGAAAVYVDGRRCFTTQAGNIGSIATNNLIIGARRTLVSQEFGTYAYDCPFSGQVDEVRVWNATLNADLLNSNRKVRLTGSEDGLVAYYPFEKKTLDEGNQVITIGDNTDLTGSGYVAQLLTLNSQLSTLNFTDEAPALRTKPAETNVSFTFVASDEKVVISLDEDAAAIEGCTLNFTVRDARDENGNYSVPAVWSAFVNRNEVAWEEDAVSCTIASTDGATFTANIINKSGVQQMWSLSGLPAWLTVSEDYGTTNPLQQTSVTFAVSPATPIGKYEETVYLRGNNGIETPLTLHVTVTGQVPDWAVNPNAFEHSMNVIGRLEIQGVPVTDTDDVVAAFIGDECRGVAHPTYMERYDSYFVTMDIYGNTEDKEKIVFRAYDASTGTLYPVLEPDTIIFEPLGLVGRYEQPVVLNALNMIKQSTRLKAGWNWMSLYVKTDNMKADSLFADIVDDVIAIKNQDDFLMPTDGYWRGSLTYNLNNGQMYAVKMKADRTLRIVGEAVDPAACPIVLHNGWNWLGYYGSQIASVADAMAGMSPENGDILKGQTGVTYFANYEWEGSLLMMEPGAGYMLYTGTSRQFGYPSSTMRAPQPLNSFTPVDVHSYSSNAIMSVRVVMGGHPVANAQLGLFVDEECRAAVVTDEDGVAYVTIPGDDEAPMTFRLALDGETAQVAETMTFTPDAIYGSPMNPVVINLDEETGMFNAQCSMLNVRSIYDLSGRKINSQLSPVNSHLKRGVYIINGEKKAVK